MVRRTVSRQLVAIAIVHVDVDIVVVVATYK